MYLKVIFFPLTALRLYIFLFLSSDVFIYFLLTILYWFYLLSLIYLLSIIPFLYAPNSFVVMPFSYPPPLFLICHLFQFFHLFLKLFFLLSRIFLCFSLFYYFYSFYLKYSCWLLVLTLPQTTFLRVCHCWEFIQEYCCPEFPAFAWWTKHFVNSVFKGAL